MGIGFGFFEFCWWAVVGILGFFGRFGNLRSSGGGCRGGVGGGGGTLLMRVVIVGFCGVGWFGYDFDGWE